MNSSRPPLILLAFALALPAAALGGIGHSGPVNTGHVKNTNQIVDLSAEHLELRSFYRSHGVNSADEQHADRAWGIQMASELPFDGMRARLDYSMTAVPDDIGLTDQPAQTTSFTAGDNHFLQVRLDNQWQDVRYGLRYFSAGADFDNVALGRDLLNQAGVAAATDGTEVWMTMRVADIEFKPSARRLVRRQQGLQFIDDQFAVLAARPLLLDTRLEYQYQTSATTTDHSGHPHSSSNTGLRNETNQTHVRLTHPTWSLHWHNFSHARQQADQARLDTAQQISGSLKLLEAFTLAPSLSRRRSEESAALIQQTSAAALSLGYQPKDKQLPQLNLTLRYHQQAGLLQNATDLSADLGIRRMIHLPGADTGHTTVSASLSYRRSENTLNGLRQGQMGLLFTFEHMVGG